MRQEKFCKNDKLWYKSFWWIFTSFVISLAVVGTYAGSHYLGGTYTTHDLRQLAIIRPLIVFGVLSGWFLASAVGVWSRRELRLISQN